MIKLRNSASLVSALIVAILTIASTAFAVAPAASASTSATTARIPQPLRQGLDTLVEQGYDLPTDFFKDTFWRDAVATSTIETYRQTTGDSVYDYVFGAGLLHYPTSFFERKLDDDTGWWGLAWLQGYQITKNHDYLRNAEAIANYIHQGGWDRACGNGGLGGGVWWQRSPRNHKNAIANELFLELTAWLYNTMRNIPGDKNLAQKYKSWAMMEWNWFSDSGMISTGKPVPVPGPHGTTKYLHNPTPKYLVRDGLLTAQNPNDTACGEGTNPGVFTYNQGVILAGLAQLYKATENPFYLTEAEHIANAVLKPPTPLQVVDAVVNSLTGKPSNILTFFGVLNEPTSPLFTPTCCVGDGAAFKGIFVRDFRMLDDVIASAPKNLNQCEAVYNNKKYIRCTTMYNVFFRTQANAIEDVDTIKIPFNSANRWFGFHWTGPDTPHDLTTQASALEALIAAYHLPGAQSG